MCIEAGAQQSDSVILSCENIPTWLWCDFGIQAAGAITVPMYPGSTAETAGKIIENSGATYAIASNPQTAAKLTLKRIGLMGEEVAEWVRRGPTQAIEVGARLARIKPDDLCTIVFTTCTTGHPNGV